MGSYSKSKGRTKSQKHVQLMEFMSKSDAWASLKPSARCVWIEIMRRYNGSNNGEIPLSCREAGKLCNISKGSAKAALDELLEKGFVKIGYYSSFTYKGKKSRRWIITHQPFNGKAPTNEWRDWKFPKSLKHGSNIEPDGSNNEQEGPLWK